MDYFLRMLRPARLCRAVAWRFVRRGGEGGAARWVRWLMLWLVIGFVFYSCDAHALDDPGPDGETGCTWYDMLCWGQQYIYWLICYYVDLVWPLVEWLLEFVPQDIGAMVSPLGYYIGVAETWFPISYASRALGSYLIFFTVLIGLKMIKIVLPGIGK